MTALALAPDTAISHEPATAAGIDRAIRVSTAIAVLAVAGVAAYVSYWHAYAVVRAHGETGVTARLEPATIDGLVYASSMLNLYAARHRLPVPALARWLLALGIVATLAANMAQGWSHGPVGAVTAPWHICIDQALRDKIQSQAPDGWLPVDQAAKALGLSRTTVFQKVRDGQLPAIHVSNGQRRSLRIQVKPEAAGLFDTPK